MKRTLTIAAAAALCALAAHAQTSNVQTVRAWTRTHIQGLPGGQLRDPTGTIADAQRLASAQATLDLYSNLVQAASAGLSNALQRLEIVSGRTNDFTGRLYLAADLDDDPGYENVQAFRVRESVETNGTIHYFVHYTRELAAPPETLWDFEVEPGVSYWSPGSTSTNNATTNVLGFACYDIAVARPQAVGNIVLLTHKFLKFGAPGKPLALQDAGLRIISGGETNAPLTGPVTYTNVFESATNVITESYLSGFLYTTFTNAPGENP